MRKRKYLIGATLAVAGALAVWALPTRVLRQARP